MKNIFIFSLLAFALVHGRDTKRSKIIKGKRRKPGMIPICKNTHGAQYFEKYIAIIIDQ